LKLRKERNSIIKRTAVQAGQPSEPPYPIGGGIADLPDEETDLNQAFQMSRREQFDGTI
jgi:hypothetical protein